jgi:hypothetical protein
MGWNKRLAFKAALLHMSPNISRTSIFGKMYR